jgi:hypothetical protein
MVYCWRMRRFYTRECPEPKSLFSLIRMRLLYLVCDGMSTMELCLTLAVSQSYTDDVDIFTRAIRPLPFAPRTRATVACSVEKTKQSSKPHKQDSTTSLLHPVKHTLGLVFGFLHVCITNTQRSFLTQGDPRTGPDLAGYDVFPQSLLTSESAYIFQVSVVIVAKDTRLGRRQLSWGALRAAIASNR